MRFALIRGIGFGTVANTVVRMHLRTEVDVNSSRWFARVPTEANIAGLPSRLVGHPFHWKSKWRKLHALLKRLEGFLCETAEEKRRRCHSSHRPTCQKGELLDQLHLQRRHTCIIAKHFHLMDAVDLA